MPPMSGPPLQRPTPTTPEDLDLARRSIDVCRLVTARPEVKQRLRGEGIRERLHQLLRTNGRRGLQIAAAEMVDLANAGASMPELELYVVFLAEVLGDLFAGKARPDLQALIAAASEDDTDEDRIETPLLMRLANATAPDLLEAARAHRRQAASSLTLARGYENEARRRQLTVSMRSAS